MYVVPRFPYVKYKITIDVVSLSRHYILYLIPASASLFAVFFSELTIIAT